MVHRVVMPLVLLVVLLRAIEREHQITNKTYDRVIERQHKIS